jgi:CheY-like chemotaxis protein/HPt (histidine-containing phosphotransfer) domain-containing protein
MTARLGRATQAGLGDTAPPTDQPEAEAERLLADRFAGARILVVEDNEINQDVIRNLLEIVGLCVDLASSGGAAIEMACRDRYDLILMDIQMPEMDGVRATQLLRGRADWRPCPVLAMTANVFEDERRRYLSEGLDDHILKPVDPPHLYAVLLQWLSANHARALAVGTDSVPGGARAAAVPDSSALLERLGGLPGVDVELGLRVLVGEERLYVRLLRKYALTHAEDVGRLRESIATGDSRGAQHLAHTLKGTSGNLGLVRIASLMAELLDGLRAGRSAAELEAPLAAAEIAQRELIERILTDA